VSNKFVSLHENFESVKRTIIKIDEELCNGCGACAAGCREGALQIINGKAVMTNDIYCDGLGACIGECPVGAITLEEREAEPYDHHAVISKSSETMKTDTQPNTILTAQPSELRQFPVQLHLLNPQASYFHKANVLLAADCSAFANGEFHSRFLKGKMLAIACPKLDENQQRYIDKLTVMIDLSQIDTLTVVIMEVPCCNGLLRIAEKSREQAQRHIPIKLITLSVQGEVKCETWM